MSNEDHSFEALAPVFSKVTKSFKSLTKGMEKLDKINNTMNAFNHSFGAFLYGLTMVNEATTWPEKPSEKDLDQFKNKRSVIQELEPAQPQKVTRVGGKRKDPPAPTPNIEQNKRRAPNVNIMSIINRLPLIYREQTDQMKNMKKVIRALSNHSEGLTSREMATEVALPSHTITPCLNALILTKDVTKKSEVGSYSKFYLNRK